MRCIVSATSLAWIVVVTTCPEIAAWMEAAMVSLSRHSPTMMSVGSRRIAPRTKAAKLGRSRGNLALVDRRCERRAPAPAKTRPAPPLDDIVVPIGFEQFRDGHAGDQGRFTRAGCAADNDQSLPGLDDCKNPCLDKLLLQSSLADRKSAAERHYRRRGGRSWWTCRSGGSGAGSSDRSESHKRYRSRVPP